jgi:hypothetical protein
VPPAKKAGATRKAPAAKKASAAQRRQAEKESRAIRRRLLMIPVLLVIAAGVIFFATRSSPSIKGELEAGPGGCVADTEHDGTDANQGAHVRNPTYTVDPPAGGPHFPTPADPGLYLGEKAPTDGELVHAMEHGFVVLWVKPDLPDDKVKQIEELSDRFGRELIVVERPSLQGEVAVTAWHQRLLCAELVPDKVAKFTRAYKDQGPEKGFL